MRNTRFSFNLVLRILLLVALLLPTASAQAAIGWVGNMWPTGGSTTNLTSGSSLDVYIQVWKEGVTDSPGQGAGITCTLVWATVPTFGGAWGTITDVPMTYNLDIGNNDEYKGSFTPAPGLYEFNVYCTDTTDSTTVYQGAGNGKVLVTPAVGSCNTATTTDNNIYWVGLGHNSFDVGFRSPFGAVKTNAGSVTLRLRTCMNDLSTTPQIRIYNDRTNADNWYSMTFDGNAVDATLGDVAMWKYTVSVPTSPTVLYYIFKAQDGTSTAYYRDDDPKFYGGGWGSPESNQGSAEMNSYQLTVYDETYTTPAWLRNAVIYQVFPERFRNGDTGNDPVSGGDWIYEQTVRKLAWTDDVCDPRGGVCPNEYSNQFYGGDLQGLIDQLDYLQQLGVTTIYLNPIFEAPSNHLYDTQDYLKIDPYFGNLTTFQTLSSEAENRGIKLMLDGVFNHVSSDSKYFDRYSRWDAAGNLTSATTPGTNDFSGACEASASSWRSWFTFVDGTPGKCYDAAGNLTQTYWDWAGYDSLAKLNSGLPAVRDYIFAGGAGSVARYWLAQGADGWRFDVGGDVDGGTATGNSNGYWAGYRTAARTQSADAALLGEEWGDSSAWLVGDQWDSVMNYRFRSAVLNWMFDSCTGNGCTGGTKFVDNDSNDGSSSGPIQGLSVSGFASRLTSIQEDYPPEAWYAMMNLMGSHDTNRVLFLLKKISSDSATAAANKFKFLGTFQFTYPGAPTIYYGDEVGLAPDGTWDSTWSKWEDDPYNRAPYPWSDQGRNPDNSIKEHFRKLAVLRGQYSVLRTGVLTDLLTDDANKVYAYARTDSGTLAVIALNRDSTAHTISVDGLDAYDGTTLYDVMNCSGAPVTCPAYTVSAGSIPDINVSSLTGAILVQGPLPAYAVSLSAVSNNLISAPLPGGRAPALDLTTLNAVVTDLGGQPVVDGTLVNFSIVSGGGSLSSDSANSVGGIASVTYYAPGGGVKDVVSLQATSGTYAGAYSNTTLFVGYSAAVNALSTLKLTIGPAVLDAAASSGVWVKKLGNGEPVVTAARFTGNPGSGVAPFSGAMTTPYSDVNLSSTSGVTEIEIRINCSGTCTSSDVLWWWDASAGVWKAFNAANTGQTGGASGYVWGKVNAASTSPTLADLTGTVLVGGRNSPTAVDVSQVSAAASASPLPVLAGVGLLALLAGVFVLRRRK